MPISGHSQLFYGPQANNSFHIFKGGFFLSFFLKHIYKEEKQQKRMSPAKPKAFTLWALTENIGQSLYYHLPEIEFLSQRE